MKEKIIQTKYKVSYKWLLFTALCFIFLSICNHRVVHNIPTQEELTELQRLFPGLLVVFSFFLLLGYFIVQYSLQNKTEIELEGNVVEKKLGGF